jgi:hypothetical protein
MVERSTEARKLLRELDSELAASSQRAGRTLVWTPQDRAVLGLIGDAVDRAARPVKTRGTCNGWAHLTRHAAAAEIVLGKITVPDIGGQDETPPTSQRIGAQWPRATSSTAPGSMPQPKTDNPHADLGLLRPTSRLVHPPTSSVSVPRPRPPELGRRSCQPSASRRIRATPSAAGSAQ